MGVLDGLVALRDGEPPDPEDRPGGSSESRSDGAEGGLDDPLGGLDEDGDISPPVDNFPCRSCRKFPLPNQQRPTPEAAGRTDD